MKLKERFLNQQWLEDHKGHYDQSYLHGEAAEVRELQQQAIRLNSQLGEVFSRRKKGRR